MGMLLPGPKNGHHNAASWKLGIYIYKYINLEKKYIYIYSSLQFHMAQSEHPRPKSILCLSTLILTANNVNLWVFPTPNSWKSICVHHFKLVAEVIAYGEVILWLVLNPLHSRLK